MQYHQNSVIVYYPINTTVYSLYFVFIPDYYMLLLSTQPSLGRALVQERGKEKGLLLSNGECEVVI